MLFVSIRDSHSTVSLVLFQQEEDAYAESNREIGLAVNYQEKSTFVLMSHSCSNIGTRCSNDELKLGLEDLIGKVSPHLHSVSD